MHLKKMIGCAREPIGGNGAEGPSSPVTSDGVLLIGGDDGNVHAFE
jgi:PQQ-like domain